MSGVLTQTIWSTLTLATQINTQTEDGTDQNKQRKLKIKLLTQTEQNNRHHTHHDVSPLPCLKNANSETNEGVVCTSRLVHRFVQGAFLNCSA